MLRSVRFHEFSGPEVLRIEDVVVPDPGSNEVHLRIKAIGSEAPGPAKPQPRQLYPRNLAWRRRTYRMWMALRSVTGWQVSATRSRIP
jgi:hypothetical protein